MGGRGEQGDVREMPMPRLAAEQGLCVVVRARWPAPHATPPWRENSIHPVRLHSFHPCPSPPVQARKAPPATSPSTSACAAPPCATPRPPAWTQTRATPASAGGELPCLPFVVLCSMCCRACSSAACPAAGGSVLGKPCSKLSGEVAVPPWLSPTPRPLCNSSPLQGLQGRRQHLQARPRGPASPGGPLLEPATGGGGRVHAGRRVLRVLRVRSGAQAPMWTAPAPLQSQSHDHAPPVWRRAWPAMPAWMSPGLPPPLVRDSMHVCAGSRAAATPEQLAVVLAPPPLRQPSPPRASHSDSTCFPPPTCSPPRRLPVRPLGQLCRGPSRRRRLLRQPRQRERRGAAPARRGCRLCNAQTSSACPGAAAGQGKGVLPLHATCTPHPPPHPTAPSPLAGDPGNVPRGLPGRPRLRGLCDQRGGQAPGGWALAAKARKCHHMGSRHNLARKSSQECSTPGSSLTFSARLFGRPPRPAGPAAVLPEARAVSLCQLLLGPGGTAQHARFGCQGSTVALCTRMQLSPVAHRCAAVAQCPPQ